MVIICELVHHNLFLFSPHASRIILAFRLTFLQKCRCENKAARDCARLCGNKPPKPQNCKKLQPQACGSLNLPTCPEGQTCIDDPKNPGCSILFDCPGICVPIKPQQCGSINLAPCPLDQSCVNNPATPACDVSSDCPGICAPPQRCGSRGLQSCPEGRYCVNDPGTPGCSTTFDCPGYCVLLDGNDCAGKIGAQCPSEQQVCVDDPRDECFPPEGRDCLGKCVFLNGRSSAGFLEE